MSAARVPVIGIVGGIGSGKTALAVALNDYFRCVRLDADAAGHRALERTDVVAALKAAFGDQILDAQGRIRRSELAQLVFGPGEERSAARKRLESIVHPHIRKDIVEQLERNQIDGECDLILLDAALLIEAGWSNDCDAVIYVDTPVEVRRQRVAQRGWSAAELANREASQLSLEEKQNRADLIIDNSENIDVVARKAASWINDRFHLKEEQVNSKTSRISTKSPTPADKP